MRAVLDSPLALRAAPALACVPAKGRTPLARLEAALADAALECSGFNAASQDAAWALYQMRDAVRLLRRIAPHADGCLGAASAETDMVGSDEVARVLRRWALDVAAEVGVALPGGEDA